MTRPVWAGLGAFCRSSGVPVTADLATRITKNTKSRSRFGVLCLLVDSRFAELTRATNERPRIPLTQFPCHPPPPPLIKGLDKGMGTREFGENNCLQRVYSCTRGNVGSITWFRVGLAVSMRGSPRRLDSDQLFPQSAFALDLRDSTPLPLERKRLRRFLNRRQRR